jgi:serine/threonine protein phosphatase PrpC
LKKHEKTLSWGHHLLVYYGISDRGLVREVNEDSYAILPEYALFILADGMGGHEAGPLASSLTIESAKKYMACLGKPEEATLPKGLTRDMLQKEPLAGIAHYANTRVYNEAAGRIIGSTLLALHFVTDGVDIIHVGDSRAYLWREEELKQLTEDHSYVYELMKAGEISREEMFTHPKRNIITRAIGTGVQVEPSLQHITILPGDLLLLCSDGLTSMASDEEIEQIIRLEKDIPTLASTLVRLANEAGGKDNITVIVVSVR